MDLWSNLSYLFDNLIKTDFQKSHSLHGVQFTQKSVRVWRVGMGKRDREC